jgi:signal transduction histidine kinase
MTSRRVWKRWPRCRWSWWPERALAETIADEPRRFSRDLRSSILDDLSADEALALFRIAQEALRNVERHSNARHVQVALICAETTVSLDVIDDGTGFVMSSTTPSFARYEKLGLMGMQERARLLGGMLAVASEPGAGTRIHVSVPLHLEHDGATNVAGSVTSA